GRRADHRDAARNRHQAALPGGRASRAAGCRRADEPDAAGLRTGDAADRAGGGVMGQRYPLPLTGAMLAVSNANAGKPRYTSMNDWLGGVGLGEDPGLPGPANQALK